MCNQCVGVGWSRDILAGVGVKFSPGVGAGSFFLELESGYLPRSLMEKIRILKLWIKHNIHLYLQCVVLRIWSTPESESGRVDHFGLESDPESNFVLESGKKKFMESESDFFAGAGVLISSWSRSRVILFCRSRETKPGVGKIFRQTVTHCVR